MEVYQEGRYWKILNKHGNVPNSLKGDWVSKVKAEEALDMFQQLVHSRAVNVTQRNRERKERASENSATAS